MVPALVLTAGLATRLRPLSFVRAKAALPIAGRPIIHRILGWLGAAGVSDAVLNLHHLPHTITTLLGDGTDLGMRVRYSWEVPILGSAGGPKRAIPLLMNLEPRIPHPGSRIPVPAGFARRAPAILAEAGRMRESTFLIVNGDTLTDVDVHALVSEHRQSDALVTMAVIPNTEPAKYGGVLVSADGSVTGFVKRGFPEPSFHFIGVQAVEPGAFADVPAGVPHETVGSLYPALLAARPGSIRAFRTTAEFMDIGTPADYLDTCLRLSARERIDLASHASISPTAHVERSVLWDDVVIEDGTMLRECVVTDGVTVPGDTSWHGVTIRNASEELAPGERRIDGLAIGAL